MDNPLQDGLLLQPWPYERVQFFLVFNVAVGGTNSYFPDGMGGKVRVSQGPTGPRTKLNTMLSRCRMMPVCTRTEPVIIRHVRVCAHMHTIVSLCSSLLAVVAVERHLRARGQRLLAGQGAGRVWSVLW